MALTKTELRAQLRALRKALTPAVRAVATEAVVTRLAASIGPDAVVASYAAHGSELDLVGLVAAAPAGTRFVWPRVTDAGLVFLLSRFESLIPGYRGLGEPPLDAPLVDRIDLVLVPGLGFDHAGRRLGQGGGFYDRALRALRASGHPPVCVGVGFEVQRVALLPDDPGDERVDLVVTEAGAFETNG